MGWRRSLRRNKRAAESGFCSGPGGTPARGELAGLGTEGCAHEGTANIDSHSHTPTTGRNISADQQASFGMLIGNQRVNFRRRKKGRGGPERRPKEGGGEVIGRGVFGRVWNRPISSFPGSTTKGAVLSTALPEYHTGIRGERPRIQVSTKLEMSGVAGAERGLRHGRPARQKSLDFQKKSPIATPRGAR